MKAKTPKAPDPIPPVRESGEQVAEKRKKQLMEERERRGMQATLMSRDTNSTGGTLG